MAKNITVADTDHKDFKMLAVERGVSGMSMFNDMLAFWKSNHPLKWEDTTTDKKAS